jgi:4'-phosphopantetheinyl transferase
MTAAWQSLATPPEILPGELHVWRARIDDLSEHVETLRGGLPDDERERSQRFRIPADQARFIIARALTRTLLCRYLQLEAADLNFAVGPIGKLHLPPPEPLKFNATHSGNMILVAVSRDGDVGVDVEHLRPLPKFQELAERYYCQREIETLNTLAHDMKQRAFFLAWTRKEALLKGDGKGLTFPLCDVEVTLTPDEPARLIQFGHIAGDAAPWRLLHLEPGDGYVGAVAIMHEAPRLRLFHWTGP